MAHTFTLNADGSLSVTTTGDPLGPAWTITGPQIADMRRDPVLDAEIPAAIKTQLAAQAAPAG